MARRKNHPEAVRVKCHLAERLREIRIELFGERGGSEMARRLGVPIRTWYNYESGVTVPAEVLLRFMELTNIDPTWLLHGRGEKFRTPPPGAAAHGVGNGGASGTVESLLRTALQQLERRPPAAGRAAPPHLDFVGGPSHQNGDDPQRRWLEAERAGRCVEVADEAMIYDDNEEPIDALEGALVVAWIQGKAVVRWFRRSGSFGLLKAENLEHSPSILLLDLNAAPHERRLRRVLWTSTPH
jgi:transcriptional regulator with XRE-family HTH domain